MRFIAKCVEANSGFKRNFSWLPGAARLFIATLNGSAFSWWETNSIGNDQSIEPCHRSNSIALFLNCLLKQASAPSQSPKPPLIWIRAFLLWSFCLNHRLWPTQVSDESFRPEAVLNFAKNGPKLSSDETKPYPGPLRSGSETVSNSPLASFPQYALHRRQHNRRIQDRLDHAPPKHHPVPERDLHRRRRRREM